MNGRRFVGPLLVAGFMGSAAWAQASDGTNLAMFPVGVRPVGVAFDGANIWVTNRFSDNVTRVSLVK